jgi:hypothetical protein
MKLALHSFVALGAGAIILTLAPASFAGAQASTALQAVADGPALGHLGGQATGIWLAPDTTEGHVSAKLRDDRGIERFELDASLTQFAFYAAAPPQGEMIGTLRVAGTAIASVFAYVQGTWIERADGRGAFHAMIFEPAASPEGPVLILGTIDGSFSLGKLAPAARTQRDSERSGVSAVKAGSARPAHGLSSDEGIIVVIDPLQRTTSAIHDRAAKLQSLDPRAPLDNHGGLGQIGQGQDAGGMTAVTVDPSVGLRGRLVLRWKLFD